VQHSSSNSSDTVAAAAAAVAVSTHCCDWDECVYECSERKQHCHNAHTVVVSSASLSGEQCVNAQLRDSTVLLEESTSLGLHSYRSTSTQASS
jgi:hypothetical protein